MSVCACGRPFMQPRELAEEVNKHERQRRDLDEAEEECALAQEGRQLDAKPFRGGDIVPLPSWRRCFKSCGIPLRKRDERLLGSLHLWGPCPAGAGRMRAR